MAVELKGLRIESFQCRNHPEREGVGICVSCRRVFCVECSTKIDGVNHCRECLAKRGGTGEATQPQGRRLFARGADALIALAVLVGSLGAVTGALVLYGDAQARSGPPRAANKARLEAIANGLRQFKADTGAYPMDDDEMPRLRELVVDSGIKHWRGPYVDLPPTVIQGGLPDVYGTPVFYWRAPDGKSCAIGSAGPDRVFESKLQNAVPLKVGNGVDAEALGDDLVLVIAD